MAFDPNRRKMPEQMPMMNTNPYFNTPVTPQKKKGHGIEILVGILVAIVLVILGIFVALSMSIKDNYNPNSGENIGITNPDGSKNELTEVEILDFE